MAIVCREYNLLFIMTPRTGCTAVGKLLCDHYGGKFVPSEDILASNGMIAVQQKHSTLRELIQHGLLGPEESSALLKLTAVRNPFDSLVSLYFKQRFMYASLLGNPASWVNRSPRYAESMKYAQTHSFNQWVFKVCYRKLAKNLLGFRSAMFPEHTQGMNIVLRYERLERDLRDTFARAGIPWKADLPRVNETTERRNREYRSFYSRLSAIAVSRAFAEDLRIYGYTF
jgi:hypothetical protein